MTLYCPSLQDWHRSVRRSTRGPSLAGYALLLVCGVGFGAWAALAPLEGAIVVSGTFVATGQNKQIQHLEGGILREILVREGDVVDLGAPLLRLDDTAPRGRLRRLKLRYYRLLTSRARLEAEIDEKDTVELPAELRARARDPEVAAVVTRQRRELDARRKKLSSEQEVFLKEIAGLQETISGYLAQVRSAEERLALFREELNDKAALYERQLIRKTDILTLQRAQAGLSGEIGELMGRIADARERVARAEQQIASLRSAALQKAIEELRETETELDDVREQMRAARDVVDRIEVRAPVRGAVVKINHHTEGGVISPGAVILELLPVNEKLLIETRVSPSQISHVSEGQRALIRLNALNQRLVPMIEGEVVYKSPDAVTETEASTADGDARRDSFIVRVKIDEDDAKAKAGDFRPTPGMPADVFIKTAERTFVDYMMQPVMDSFSRAFREH